MEYVGKLLETCLQGLKREIVMYGHSISWWQIYVFIIVASILTMIISGILFDD